MPAPPLYDFMGFGDEVPGILALVSVAREHGRQTSSYPRSLLIASAASTSGNTTAAPERMERQMVRSSGRTTTERRLIPQNVVF